MIDPFYLAAIPEPRIILGLRLRPLSLGHQILLHRIGSPFAMGGDPDFGDLATAILLCSMTYEEGVKVLEDPDIDRFMQAWHDRITGNDRWLVRIGLKPVMVLDFREKMKAFADYLEEHSRSPHYSYTPGDFRQMDCPNVQIVRVTLMRDLHLSDSEVMDRPWVMCLWDYITLKALAGQVAICNKDEISEAQEVANRLQAILDSRKGAVNGAS